MQLVHHKNAIQFIKKMGISMEKQVTLLQSWSSEMAWHCPWVDHVGPL
jgi:hypothetical protein